MVETNNSTSSNPGTLAILGTTGILGVDNVTGSIDNESNIDLIYNGSGTSTELEIAGDMAITGLVILA